MTNGHPHTRPFAYGFSSEEGVKEPLLNLLGHTCTVVSNLNRYSLLVDRLRLDGNNAGLLCDIG